MVDYWSATIAELTAHLTVAATRCRFQLHRRKKEKYHYRLGRLLRQIVSENMKHDAITTRTRS